MLSAILGIAGVMLLAIGIPALYVVYRVLRKPARYNFSHHHPGVSAAQSKKVVICAGDSITQATVSGDWIALLRQRLPDFVFLNAGVNGDCAYNVANKAAAIRRCQPSAVVVLIGTNDAKAEVSASWGRQTKLFNRLPQEPTHDFYRSSLTTALEVLTADDGAPPPPLAVLTLPMLGEDPGHVGNKEVVPRYNEVLQDVVAAVRKASNHPIHILDLTAALWKRLTELKAASPQPSQRPPPVENFFCLMWQAAALHYLLGWSLDAVGQRSGQGVMVDALHLNDSGAAVVAQLVEDWLGKVVEQDDSAGFGGSHRPLAAE